MTKRTVLTADKGYILTDGETYGTVIYLAEGRSSDKFHEITDAEYKEIENEKMGNERTEGYGEQAEWINPFPTNVGEQSGTVNGRNEE